MTESVEVANDHMVLVSGESATGKSACLRNIPDQHRWIYLNTEAGKKLPFKNSFKSVTITNPYDIVGYFEDAIAHIDQVDGIIIDTVTFMMEMLETQYVINAANTQAAWGEYQQFFKRLFQQKVAAFGKPVIVLGHTKSDTDDQGRTWTSVPVKGALKNNGIEAYFSTVISTKRIPLTDLEKYQEKNELLHINEEDEIVGFKYVFQTRLTRTTTGERIRAPMGMWSIPETYIDNDIALVLQRLDEFYEGNEA